MTKMTYVKALDRVINGGEVTACEEGYGRT